MHNHSIASTVLIALLALTFCSIVPVRAASVWNVQTVDVNAGGFGNGYCPIVVDTNNAVHIAYTNSDPRVEYASWNGSGWSSQKIDYGITVDLALDANGNPHILYETWEEGLKYASWTGTKWNSKTITGHNVVYASLALDSADNPHVTYTDGEGLKYASWPFINIRTVDASPDVQIKLSLALDSNNNPYIMYVTPSSYLDNSTGINYHSTNVKLATYQNSSWSIQTVPLPPPTGDYGNIVLDSKGYPHFVCMQHDTILYASLDGSAWNTQTMVSNVTSILRFKLGFLALDSNDSPHFNYITSSGELIYASLTGTVWNTQAVNTNITARGPCYLAVDSEGNPHISYRGIGPNQSLYGTTATMMYATANATDFTQPTSPTQDSLTFPTLPLAVTAVIIGAVVTVGVYFWKKKISKKP